MNPTQIGLPTSVTPQEVAREKTLGGAIELCAKAAGYAMDKELQMQLGVDKAQFSRWQSGQEGIVWPKLRALMDLCGNHAPVFWMLYELGYDLSALRKRESETEKALREALEQLDELKKEREIERRLLRDIKAAA